MLQFRIFISSPGDASIERRRAENVISRLNGEIAGLARLTAVRWETEHYKAHETFQSQIPPAADCEVVVGVLKWRLGTALPPGFDPHPSGEPYPSGTAYELLTAIEKRKAGGPLPDVFVFRYSGGSPHPPLDHPRRADIERDWASLRAFFERWFISADGHFLAALNNYADEDDFETQLETLLRKWLAEKVAGGGVVPWPAMKGSPFRGLGVFGARHAPVFFGRAGDIRRAGDLWRDYAARGTKFLLIVGASGAGKSSLARAGLIPRLITPGVVPDVDLWRIAVMRPGDSPAGPFQALAAALLQDEANLPPEEEGRGPALPEIAEGDSKTPAELAAVLSHADAGAIRPLTNALARIGDRTKEADQYGREVRCDLVLLIDQLEELLAPSMPADVRAKFAALMASIVSTGRVWVVATLRADLYASMLEVDVLKALKDIGASYDLTPPGAAELAEIVRAPAEAAALTFETDPATGETLDERLLREADRPDMLPLVQLALSRLWEARESRDGATILPIAAFEKLGGVKGIVEEAGEAALGKVGETERARLAPLIRRLAELTHTRAGAPGTLTARAESLAEVAGTPADKTLVDALVTARLLTLHNAGGVTTVRLSHQRVLTDWARAAAIVGESADFYRVRDDVESQRLRWEAARRPGELLLARGLPLAEARKMAGTYRTELAPETHAYIVASQRRAARAQMFGWAAAAVFAVFAVGAGVAAKVALDQKAQAEIARQEAETQKAHAEAARKDAEAQKARAETARRDAEMQRAQAEAERKEAEAQKAIAQRNFEAARTAVDGLIFNIAQGLRNVVGMRLSTIQKILETARQTADQLAASVPNDQQLLRSRAVMFDDFASTYKASGDLKDAFASIKESQAIFRKLLAQNPEDQEAQRDLSVSLSLGGGLELQSGDETAALAAYTEAMAIDRKRVAQNTSNSQTERDLASDMDDVGGIKLKLGDQTGALALYRESLGIYRKVATAEPDNADAQRDLSSSLISTGDVSLQAGDQAGALAAFQESLAIARKLALADPGNAQVQREVTIALERIGGIQVQAGNQAHALAGYKEALDLDRQLATQDPGNTQSQRNLAIDLEKVGSVTLQAGDQAGALADYKEALAIDRKLAAQDPEDAVAQRDVSVALERLGGVQVQAGDQAGALATYQEALSIDRRLAAKNAGDTETQRDLAIDFEKIGDVQLQIGDQASALASYQQSVDIYRKLAAMDRNNMDAARDLAIGIENIGNVDLQAGDQAGALAAFNESVEIYRKRAESDVGNTEAQRDLTIGLEKVASVKMRSGDSAGALAIFKDNLATYRKIAALDLGNAEAQRDVSVELDRVGDIEENEGDHAGALAAYQEGLDIDRKLAARDSGNAEAQRDLAISLEKVGNLTLAKNDQAGALRSYQESLAIYRKLATQETGNAEAQRDLALGLEKIGDVKLKGGDRTAALDSYKESVGILRQLATKSPDNAEAQRDLALGLGKIGNIVADDGDLAGATAAYQEDVSIYRKLAARDSTNAEAQRDLAIGLERVGNLKLQVANPTAALALYKESLALYRKLVALSPNDTEAQRDLAIGLDKVSDASQLSGDQAGALAASKEALALYRKLAKNSDSSDARSEFVDSLGNTAYAALTARDYAGALSLSDEAIALAPDAYWLYLNRACALMMLGKTDDARVLFLKYRGETSRNDTPWERAVRTDFARFRNLGITNPLMDEIEADFAKPPETESGKH